MCLRLGAISDGTHPASASAVPHWFVLRSRLQDNMPQTPPFTTGGYNNNVYQTKEEEEEYSGLYFHDSSLVSGSLEALIHHLVPTVDYYPDVSLFLSLSLLQRDVDDFVTAAVLS